MLAHVPADMAAESAAVTQTGRGGGRAGRGDPAPRPLK